MESFNNYLSGRIDNVGVDQATLDLSKLSEYSSSGGGDSVLFNNIIIINEGLTDIIIAIDADTTESDKTIVISAEATVPFEQCIKGNTINYRSSAVGGAFKYLILSD